MIRKHLMKYNTNITFFKQGCFNQAFDAFVAIGVSLFYKLK